MRGMEKGSSFSIHEFLVGVVAGSGIGAAAVAATAGVVELSARLAGDNLPLQDVLGAAGIADGVGLAAGAGAYIISSHLAKRK